MDVEKGVTPLDANQRSGQQAATQMKETALQAASQTGETIREQAELQKGRAADTLTSVAQALRQTGGELKRQDQPAGRYAERAAEQVDRFAGHLRNREVSQLMDEVSSVARRQPALFLAGALTLGVIGARFLKTSGSPAARQSGYSSGGYRTPETPVLATSRTDKGGTSVDG